MTKQESTREYKGNAILIAGYGAGKTRIIAAKMKYLSETKQLPLADMKLLTFSKEVATEIE